MNAKQAHIIAYSPTGTTLQNLKQVAAGMGFDAPVETNVTLPPASGMIPVDADTVAIIGAPVYSGRIAPEAMVRLKQLSSKGAPAVVVAVYGNRAYDDALIELKDLAEKAGFVVIGAAAMLGQHSFSTDEKPIAVGRPDAKDDQAAQKFGKDIVARLAGCNAVSELSEVAVPGTVPTDVLDGRKGASPKIDVSLCSGCGVCVAGCPMGAISLVDDVAMIEYTECTFCCACMQHCPNNAVSVTFEPIVKATNWLYENCQERREPEFYL
ncbi:MAG: 4Fe-4S binding protein [Desulfovibrionales bacterium]|nr:4Fe-4S binding protein [Desulfovibrionales bacterium]